MISFFFCGPTIKILNPFCTSNLCQEHTDRLQGEGQSLHPIPLIPTLLNLQAMAQALTIPTILLLPHLIPLKACI